MGAPLVVMELPYQPPDYDVLLGMDVLANLHITMHASSFIMSCYTVTFGEVIEGVPAPISGDSPIREERFPRMEGIHNQQSKTCGRDGCACPSSLRLASR